MQELKRIEPDETAIQPASEVGELIKVALAQGQSPAELYALLREERAHRAEMEFNRALAGFQAECPMIRKTSTAKIATRSGSNFGYKYAELDEIAATIRPAMKKNGLSYTWNSAETAGVLTCTCIIRHSAGHSATATFSCPTASDAGMSPMQKSASALTYARRQSLVQALGLTTCDPDNDGAMRSPITPAQVESLEKLIVATESNRDKFLAYAGAGRMEDVPSGKFAALVAALKSKGGTSD